MIMINNGNKNIDDTNPIFHPEVNSYPICYKIPSIAINNALKKSLMNCKIKILSPDYSTDY